MACGLFFGLHIITASRYVGGRNPALLTMIQFIVAGALAWIFAVAFEPFPVEIPRKAAFSLIYLTVVATGMCFLLQVFGQKYTPPSQTAIIMSLESVFGAGISILFFDETLTVSLFIGFLLVFAAVLVSETKLGFIRTRRQDKKIL
jgi:drug/metabolite transporter (DMT)-like permease